MMTKKNKLKCFRILSPVVSLFIINLLCQLTPIFAHAQYFNGPLSLGTGGAIRASNEPSEQIFLNPAVLPHAKPLTSTLFYNNGQTNEYTHDNVLGISMVDNTDDVFLPGAIGYIQRKRRFKFSPEVEEHYVNASLGGETWKHLTFGGSLIWLKQEERGQEATTQWNGTIGFLYNPLPDMAFALVYSHFIKPDSNKIPDHLQLIPQVALGFNYVLSEYFRYRLDLSQNHRFNPQNKWTFETGLESYMHQLLLFRLGGKWDGPANEGSMSVGLGFDGPRLKMDYAYVKNTKDSHGALHSVDLRVNF